MLVGGAEKCPTASTTDGETFRMINRLRYYERASKYRSQASSSVTSCANVKAHTCILADQGFLGNDVSQGNFNLR